MGDNAMRHVGTLNPAELARGGGFGAAAGVGLVILMLAIDAFGFGSMMRQTESVLGHLLLMLVKPALLFGLLGVGWSMWRHLGRT